MIFHKRLLLALLALLAYPALAAAPKQFAGRAIVSFSGSSSTLSDSAKVSLARRLPHMHSLNILLLITTLNSELPATQPALDRKRALDADRVKSIRQFFVDANTSDRMWSEVRPYGTARLPGDPINTRPDGTVEIEYMGYCKPGYLSICKDQ
jgi:hypothetical protein